MIRTGKMIPVKRKIANRDKIYDFSSHVVFLVPLNDNTFTDPESYLFSSVDQIKFNSLEMQRVVNKQHQIGSSTSLRSKCKNHNACQ